MKEDAAAWEKLLYVLDWILAVKVRHTDSLHFSLVHVSFGDKAKLGNAYGATTALQLLVDVGHELRQAMRKTDIVARDGTDFWVLIPHAEAESVVPKVTKIVEIAADNGLDVVDRDVSVFALDHGNQLKELRLDTPEAFLNYVKRNRNVTRSWAGSR